MTWRIRMKVLFQVRAGPLHHPPAPSSRGYALDEEGEGSTAGGCCADGGGTRPTIPVAGGAQLITIPRRVFFRRCLVWSNRTVPFAHRLRFSGHASTRSRAFVQPNPDARVRMNVGRHCREFVLATAAPPYDRRTEAICIGNIDLQEPDVFDLPIM